MSSHQHRNGTVVMVNGEERMCASELGGTVKAALRDALFTVQGGLCAMCGQAMRLDALAKDSDGCEVSHLLPGCCGSKTGIVEGNVFAGCRRCNLNSREVGDLRPFVARFVRADLIPATFPAGWRKGAKVTPRDQHATVSDAACAAIFA